jgi:simple sugar transport system ATP-binding protein
MAAGPLLELRGVRKRYPAVVALDGASLDVERGEIHAVLGENGAGKSTLMKVICGAVRPDAGEVRWEGAPAPLGNPALARSLGIAMVFQHFALFETVSVVENIALALPGRLALRPLAKRIEAVAGRYGLPVNPWRPVYELSVGERQRVEIVRCLLQSPRLLIMDEPTSVLPPQAVEQLFETLRGLAGEGVAILYVSHKLAEIRSLCDRATVLRAGKVVARVDPRQESEQSLAELMIGRDFPRTQRRGHAAGDTALELIGLSAPADGPFGTPLQSVSLRLRAGEVLGVAGISGNGQAELLAALSGEIPVQDPQSIWLGKEPIGKLGAAQRRRLGMAYVPEERLGKGAVPEMSLAENALLTAYQQLATRAGLVDRDTARRYARRCIEEFDVRCAGPDAPAQSLSGGNLQKFIVGREIAQKPRVLIVAQPTWGVDVAATALIRQRLIDLAGSGVAILVVSEDLGEILEICDRVAVIAGGRLSPLREVSQSSAEQIGRWMAGDFADSSADSFPESLSAPAATVH